MDRLDRTMKEILRAGTYELIARGDVPVGAVVSEYVDVAKAFFDQPDAGFANGLPDAIGQHVRQMRRQILPVPQYRKRAVSGKSVSEPVNLGDVRINTTNT